MNDKNTDTNIKTTPKKKVGRPRKSEAEKLVVVTFRVTPEMARKIRALGAASAWIFRDFWTNYFAKQEESSSTD